MRSAIKVFKGAIDEDTGAYFSAELKLAAGMLGAIRDIDVFKINLNVYRKQLDYFPDRVKQRLEKEIDAVRLTPFKTLLNYLKSTRYKKFERRIESYIGRLADCLEQPEGEVTLGRFAPEIITRDWQAVIKQGAAVLANPAMQKFHLLRIETKKLRYAAEFMAPAYQGALAPFIQRTGEIQDCLGELQDTVFTREFSRRLMQENQGSGDRSPVSFVLGEIYQYQAETAGERRATFKDLLGALTAQKPEHPATGPQQPPDFRTRQDFTV
jgi:CHAD domain-containing protein